MNNTNFDLQVLINDKPIREYWHEGNFFIEGRKNSEFSIRLQNNSSLKIKAILSVDGLSIVDGQPAGENSSGYIIQPYSFEIFKGWRVSDTSINKFVFSSKKRSYSNRIDQGTSNVGVIGAMIFNQKIEKMVYRSTPSTILTSSMFPMNALGTTSWLNDTQEKSLSIGNLGTGFGEEIQSNVIPDYSKFESNPTDILCLYYDDKEGLEKRGIVVDPSKSYPNAFPNYIKTTKYARRPMK